MRKAIYTIVVALLCPFITMAQHVKEGKVKVGKTSMIGFIATSKYDRTQVEEAIAQKLTDAGVKKHKKKKKFFRYKEISIPELSPAKIDVYYRVASRKKHKSRIYWVISKGYDNYITSATDASAADNVTRFLSGIDAIVEHNEEIKQKEQEVKNMNDNIQKQKDALKKQEEEKNKKNLELQQLQKDR